VSKETREGATAKSVRPGRVCLSRVSVSCVCLHVSVCVSLTLSPKPTTKNQRPKTSHGFACIVRKGVCGFELPPTRVGAEWVHGWLAKVENGFG
jgi:hypothetical protein